MGSFSVLLLIVPFGLCLSLYYPATKAAPTADTAEDQLMLPAGNPYHLVQRRTIIFRPIFLYRQQEIEKQRKHETREQNQQDNQGYQQQLQEYEQQMQDYKQQMQQYKQQHN
ncbi:transcription factor SPT20 homolog [Wyeomyia smithii]|uniref:transcription factor SPT20 homolog n=1 Tax=Wyeomyia smithii TaxID=174621 RepID=UPI002467F201|nr:transcription factor SPT20 homolog [Wyeomyia smithii]